jgi:starch-binding outer membrane protein, SusD/RagB family
MHMAEYFCNGIPLGETINGVIEYSEPLTNQQVYALAIAHLDSAIALSTGTTTLASQVRNAALVSKARALMDVGQSQYAAAAALVTAVPVAFQYTMTYTQATQSNEIWNLNFSRSSARYTVGDSLDLVNNQVNVIKNALPFASAADPRVPVTGSSTSTLRGIDNLTAWVGQQIWVARETPVVLVSGVDARLVEAEAKLLANDIAGMMTILNALRTSTPTLGTFKPANMAALATPATKDAATNLFFREKAFWQFARGTRLGDLRRLVRQYGRTQDNVFPSGAFHKEGLPYGSDVNLPVTDSEKTNPNFKGCTDRNA